MAGVKALIAAVALMPSVALACSPSPAMVTPAPVMKDGCAVHWAQDEYRVVGLGPVTDLGNGLSQQVWFDGNACYWHSGLVVQDCASGEAIVIGADSRDLMEDPKVTGIDRVEAALAALGGRASLEKAVALTRAEGYGAPDKVAPGRTLSIGDVPLPRDCACKTLYPDAAGGTE